MFLTPLYRFLETYMTLVGTCYEYIKINFLHNLVHIRIGDYLIHIADGLYHVFAVFSRVENFGCWFVFQDEVAILGCYNQVITKAFGASV